MITDSGRVTISAPENSRGSRPDMKQLFVPLIRDPHALRFTKHPVFHLAGLRGIIADHSEAEESLLASYAAGRKTLVEIGVAEGASALALRKVADPAGVLYLIDPYPTGRVPGLSLKKICAHRHVGRCGNASVRWIQDYSYNASRSWEGPIDFLFIDGDHSYEACMRDWAEWSRFVAEGGVVAFHDARVFPNGWTADDWGSVRVVNELFRSGQSAGWRIVEEADSLVIVRSVRSPR
jgi:predicted O-methyltransferase YrrM